MNWITKLAPKIKSILGGKKSLKVADNSWVKCSQCQTMLYSDDLEKNYYVCPNCDLHLYIHPRTRMKNLFDEGIYEEIPYPTVQLDPLNFKDTNSYKEKFKEAQAKTEMQDAFLIGYGKMKGISTTVVAMNFKFMGGSLSSAGAEAMVKAAEHAISYNTPFIMITSSGGARMQENQLSLQALPKTTIAVQMVKDAKLPYIVILTDPTSGGVTASFAMLGDVTIAEPKALICFAGPRVIANTVGETLPDGFQRSEFLLDHGFIDQIIHRKDLKDKLVNLLSLLLKRVA
ncbi:acetyl-CoA carboxylase, carboxyltransferase subunit beta [Pelagibacterales bacterium]|jgi:acetyl-CoA carboxylase carboxyl transferase subunit beta|nr:acetyl-CoA carboxylase carboxyltransferase subunit beta [Pelagibacterales bacterium]MDA9981023.1 acetyl-CoA carboxylase, carboxyltransferase subunit beta [Pelagibacterales bacterium]MDB9818813.1 acetyl-CoA carboxylase, carboxyltransferase subunit beta [Pelagibacterales bacterium]|tara:strand:+ start:243 stop:1103 length:861 start_codon:yes stop_codon:yes gene_type:complete